MGSAVRAVEAIVTREALRPYVGRLARYVPREGFTVNVSIIAARVAYGRGELCIEPVSGAGHCWVNHEHVEVMDAVGAGEPDARD